MLETDQAVQEENSSVQSDEKTTDAALNNVKSTTEETKIEQQEETIVGKQDTIQEEIYPIKDLIENCKALGYKKEVVAGALFNCEKTEMSKSEFEKTIQNFLGKKVN